MKKRETNKVYCGLGSNVGDRKFYLEKAIELLNDEFSETIKISSFYETKPLGNASKENYLNAAAEVETTRDLFEFYRFVKNIEKEIGRKTTRRWGPREIDIDILLFNDEIYDTPELSVPHRGLAERDFVLQPLLELAGDIEIPGINKKISELLNNLQNHYILMKI